MFKKSPLKMTEYFKKYMLKLFAVKLFRLKRTLLVQGWLRKLTCRGVAYMNM